MTTGWQARIISLLLLVAALYVGLTVFDYQPRLLPLALLVTVGVSVAWSAVDTLGELGPNWEVGRSSASLGPGQDARLATYLRIIESHTTSSAPDADLRDRLALLMDQRLAQRHDLDRRDPQARELVGADLLALVEGPARRMTYDEIDRHVRRIEEL
jgi:hypothetical protein